VTHHIGLALLAPLLAYSAAHAADIEGNAKPVDGDSFNIEIRLFGIDTPEASQTCKDSTGADYPCGRIASDAMAALLDGKTVVCEKQDQDMKHGRPVAICYADGVDVGAEMVERGLAVAYRKYSDKYVPQEERARAAKRGLWAGTFEWPWDYRARKRLPTVLSLPASCPPPTNDPACRIKGNISKAGRIYHMPGSRDYEKVSIKPSRGERYFCTEEEAVRCGWRKPRN
jgi:endonuclease YncB( thermonuclease family)